MRYHIMTLLLLGGGLTGCTDRSAASGGGGGDPAAVDAAAELPGALPDSTPVVTAGDTLVAQADYRCGKSVTVTAAYWNGQQNRVTLIMPDTALELPQTISASGARYGGSEPTEPEWWVKGDSARFTWGQTFHCAVARG